MDLGRCFVSRLHGLLIRWNVVPHPYGPAYASDEYSRTGRFTGTGASGAPVDNRQRNVCADAGTADHRYDCGCGAAFDTDYHLCPRCGTVRPTGAAD